MVDCLSMIFFEVDIILLSIILLLVACDLTRRGFRRLAHVSEMASDEGGSSGSELIDFVLYMFVLGPAVEWCLKSPKVNPGGKPGSARGIALAVVLLAVIAGAKMSFDFVGTEPNHFSTLGVRVDASSYDVRQAFKQIGLKEHPDKKPGDKHAAEKFIKYQAAYEVLKDERRDKSFGE